MILDYSLKKSERGHLQVLTLPDDELVHLFAKVVLIFSLQRDSVQLHFFAQFNSAVVQRKQGIWDLLSIVVYLRFWLFGHAQFAEDLTTDSLYAFLLHHLQVQSLAGGHTARSSHHAQGRQYQANEPHGAKSVPKLSIGTVLSKERGSPRICN